MSAQINPNQNSPHEVKGHTVYQFKIILVGDSAVGKTSLVNRFMGSEFQDNITCTIKADLILKSLSLDPSTGVDLTVWDTCGQEKFRSITRQYFKDAHGIILVYDVNNENSFRGLSSWLNEIKSNCNNKNVSIVLVGNKIDLSERIISKEEGNDFAQKNGLLFVETSSKDGININTPFENLSNDIIQKIKQNPNDFYNEQNLRKIVRYDIEREREKEYNCC